MGFHLPRIVQSKNFLRLQSLVGKEGQNAVTADVPKGHITVYVGDSQMKRFAVPISYLNHPSFRLATSGRRRVWIQSSNGWSHNSM
ncbi:Auxin-induced protein [Macleaya cordata]|uniref:Auxin-induced protein n=1 Tax=Macleaya cordata TaxID=56857 RepID=A0A200QQR7_MACCD|nr:Auxin-induced protein [Macleaya cordata]